MADDKKWKSAQDQEAETKAAAQAASDSLDTKIANAVGKGIEAALPLAMAAVGQTLGNSLNPKKAQEAAQEFSSSDRCEKCGQMRRACKNKHVLLVVAPANPRRYQRFPGCIVNGITYISPRPGAPIYVPAENDVLHQLQVYEEEEDNLREGHKLDHNSGTLSPIEQNQQVNSANPRGFRGMMPGSGN